MQIAQLIVGGSDTTRVAIVAQVAFCLQHREQWEAACRDPALVPGAVAEAVRFEPSAASFARVTIEDIELGEPSSGRPADYLFDHVRYA